MMTTTIVFLIFVPGDVNYANMVWTETLVRHIFRYAMKAEASGHIGFNPDMVRRIGMGLMGCLTEAQCKLASATWVTKPVVPTEAALAMLRIPVVQCTGKVVAVNTEPPEISAYRARRAGKGDSVCLAPIDKYMARPATYLDHLTLTQYFRKYYVSKAKIKRGTSPGGVDVTDNRGRHVYKRDPQEIVRRDIMFQEGGEVLLSTKNISLRRSGDRFFKKTP
ncbi:hypothetical protein CEUSTIGMA_g5440.t1 [Chlamydomonas eustigma]|uniref:Uncharacterized protein n=1 Tax=Chlamydomonas eustigma TaxID=1157962 RepID=A0A250X4I9_9CHLO|nr:hypothetical protein CEUSTIGMA_g5440.t1 [Chlamydomonas eustigma]|eukprot:GAX77998.1 hypothetical protein CEUSTIGMA_g5440.t1 [Chlamydomonas eustigma]